MADIVMPRLSDTMEEGTILRWLKRDGEDVRRGEELVEIETDKATMNYESDQDGILETVAKEGDTLAVGELIARVGADGVAPAGPTADAGLAGAGEEMAARGSASAAAPHLRAAPPGDRVAGVSATDPAVATPPSGAERVKASPLARRIARESGVDLHTLTGSGPRGRIVKADVEGAGGSASTAAPAPALPTGAPSAPAPEAPAVAPAAPAPQEVVTAKGETSTVELSRTQQTIARRMAESKATIPDFTLQAEVDMEQCVALRSELKGLLGHRPAAAGERAVAADAAPTDGAAEVSPATPTYNDMVVKACALALREHPRANGSYRDGHVQLHSRVNVGVAVAVASDASAGGGLVVPTVFDADLKSLGEIARETRALSARVREGTITPPELSGGTFTVSNLGMYGVVSFTAIINPPQAAILSVGSLARRAVVRQGEIAVRHTIALTLVCDHRILYGADAAEFLRRVGELLEAPTALAL
jgi:pyruvate dehydrogenase E2 component (dihydrolipoamide acetyltransferase)